MKLKERRSLLCSDIWSLAILLPTEMREVENIPTELSVEECPDRVLKATWFLVPFSKM